MHTGRSRGRPLPNHAIEPLSECSKRPFPPIPQPLKASSKCLQCYNNALPITLILYGKYQSHHPVCLIFKPSSPAAGQCPSSTVAGARPPLRHMKTPWASRNSPSTPAAARSLISLSCNISSFKTMLVPGGVLFSSPQHTFDGAAKLSRSLWRPHSRDSRTRTRPSSRRHHRQRR